MGIQTYFTSKECNQQRKPIASHAEPTSTVNKCLGGPTRSDWRSARLASHRYPRSPFRAGKEITASFPVMISMDKCRDAEERRSQCSGQIARTFAKSAEISARPSKRVAFSMISRFDAID